MHRCRWQTNIKHNHCLSGLLKPHSVVFPLGPVRTQVSSSQNLVVKVNLSQRCKGGRKPVVKLSSEVSGMCLPAAVRFNMAGSVCSHRRQDFLFCESRKRFTCAPLSTSLAVFHHFEKRKAQIESICEKEKKGSQERERRVATH